jgi:hypothetical protein
MSAWQRSLGFLIAFACGSSVCGANAVTAPPPNPSASCASAEYIAQAKEAAQPSSPNEFPTLVVVEGTAPLNTTEQIKMGQQVTVCIMGLHRWIYQQKQQNPSDLRLFIGGHLLTKMAPSAISLSGQEYLNFTLQMDTADSDDWKAWAAIVDDSRHSENGQLPISVGIVGRNEFYESNAVVKILPYPKRWPYLLGVFALLLGALLWLAATSDLLRYAVGERPSLPQMSPFSLGLVQMAFWFYLVLAAYVYICVSTHQVHIPMGSVLGLLGISSTTGLAAVFVDKQKDTNSQSQRNSLQAERAALDSKIANPLPSAALPGSAAEADLAQKRSRLAAVDAAILQLPPVSSPAVSKSFLQDVLNDGNGISFHRFQIAIWTIVLGTVFVWAVYRNISMPEFDASLLTLMGISSGTYIGFKFPEKPK